jgi:predicted nucleotidyltransferase
VIVIVAGGRGECMPMNEIEELNKQFVEKLSPIRIYLFGSYVNGTYTEHSDFDFYIVVRDDVSDLAKVTSQAYRSIRRVKQRPVDIVVGTESRFEQRKEIPSVENEVYHKGVLLYGRSEEMD